LRATAPLAIIALAACADAPATAPRLLPAETASAAKQGTSSSTILVQTTTSDGSSTQVFSMNDDGTNVVQITNLTLGFNASWAPDGKQIVFLALQSNSSPFELGIMKRDGTGMTFFNPTPCGEGWPVALGKQVMFVGCNDLYSVNVDGTGLTQLTQSGDIRTDQPSPGAHARTVAFTRFDGDIWLLDVATGGLTNLTNTPGPGVAEVHPAFSPSGKQIAFVRCTDSCQGIWVMNADGTGLTQLTAHQTDQYPRWSPDGKRIAFSSLRDDPTYFDVFTVASNGTGVTNLTRTPGRGELATAWAPY
jgi:Tol biopolymer transport system component